MMNDETLTNARYLGLRMLDLYSGGADELLFMDELLDDAGQELLRLDSENEELRRENERLRELLIEARMRLGFGGRATLNLAERIDAALNQDSQRVE